MSDGDLEVDGGDRGSDGLTDGELDLDCTEPWRDRDGVVSSDLDLLGGAAESIIVLMFSRSPGTSKTQYIKNKE